MKITVLTSSYPRFPGDGTAPFVRSICEHFVKLGSEVDVVAPYDPAIMPFDTAGVRLHRFHYIWPKRFHIMGHARSLSADIRLNPLVYILLPFFLISASWKLLRVTAQTKCEVIHVHWVLPNGLLAALVAARRGIPFVVSLHGSDIFVARKNPLFRKAARFVFRRAAAVTACSGELRQEAIRLGSPEKTLLLAWGADPALFTPELRNPALRQAFGWNPSQVIIGSLGRMVYKKGFGSLISVLPLIIAKHPAAHLVLGGDGPLRQELVRQVEGQNLSEHVSFLGRIAWDRVPDFLANIDIFVLPSVRDQLGNVDGLPTVLLEAMSAGNAVVASQIGGVNLVIEHGLTGLIVPPGDPSKLADAICVLVRDSKLRLSLGEAARKAVVSQFNWEAVAKTFLTLFSQVME